MIKYKDYGIEPNDCGGYVLSEIKIYGNDSKFKGQEYYRTICYPSTLKGCFTQILNLEMAKKINENDYTIQEAINELERINNELTNEFYKNVKEEIR